MTLAERIAQMGTDWNIVYLGDDQPFPWGIFCGADPLYIARCDEEHDAEHILAIHNHGAGLVRVVEQAAEAHLSGDAPWFPDAPKVLAALAADLGVEAE